MDNIRSVSLKYHGHSPFKSADAQGLICGAIELAELMDAAKGGDTADYIINQYVADRVAEEKQEGYDMDPAEYKAELSQIFVEIYEVSPALYAQGGMG